MGYKVGDVSLLCTPLVTAGVLGVKEIASPRLVLTVLVPG
jgi:hypothetical protein